MYVPRDLVDENEELNENEEENVEGGRGPGREYFHLWFRGCFFICVYFQTARMD
jgi:hypothetical protein